MYLYREQNDSMAFPPPLLESMSCGGIDKLTCRHGLAIPDSGVSAQYVDASAHCERIPNSKHAPKFRILITEHVNLSIPYSLFSRYHVD